MTSDLDAMVRVLVVDEDVDRMATLALLLREGAGSVTFSIALANSVGMACERAKAGTFDVLVVVSDFAEPPGGGLGLLDTLAIEVGRVPPHLLLGSDSNALSDVDAL